MNNSKLYSLLTLLVIVISGDPAISVLGKYAVYIGTLIIFLSLWLVNPIRLRKQDGFVVVLFFLLTFTHVFSFGSMVIPATIGFLIKIIIAMLAVRLIPGFSRRYVAVMYYFSLLSFVFWVPSYFGVNMQSIFSSIRVPLPNDDYFSIGIYNFGLPYYGPVRNYGIFWEPGAFAGYLVLALFFLLRDCKNKHKLLKQGLVLIASLLSTQSTTGYIVFMVMILYFTYVYVRTKRSVLRLILFPALVVAVVGGAYFAMTEFSFLGEKINIQLKSASAGDDASRINRFGNFLYDLDSIASRPIFGWSATPETRDLSEPGVADLIALQGNGLTSFAVRFGLVGLVIFFGFFAYNMRRETGSVSIVILGTVIVCLVLNGEQFLNYPMFLTLMFMPDNKFKPLPSIHLAKA